MANARMVPRSSSRSRHARPDAERSTPRKERRSERGGMGKAMFMALVRIASGKRQVYASTNAA
jgi:hypothetical protein